MVSQKEILAVSDEIECLRDNVVKLRKLKSEQVWPVLDRLSEMVERGRGTKCEEQLQVLYSLVESVWMVTGSQEQLREAYRSKFDKDDLG